MSLPDSAEYWWDVKGKNRTSKLPFTHIKGIACGHYHVYETNDISQIDCSACKKIISEIPDIKNELVSKFEQGRFPNGKCTCGKPLIKRINKSNGNMFLGCINYPKCKNTKSITTQNPSLQGG